MAVNEHPEPPSPADRRIAVLYREAAREEAPAHLDARLMAAAREGLAPRPAAARAPWWIAWRLPFAFAAVAVVSVSLVTLVMDEGGDRLTPEQAPVAAPPYSPPAAVAEAPSAVAETDPSAPAPSAARK
ncbi:MAG TPA: hypothetical protein VD867_13445, partial [Burkholderiales bacterium]|nr:hypothetical protein [Burkholderiales bacterium]